MGKKCLLSRVCLLPVSCILTLEFLIQHLNSLDNIFFKEQNTKQQEMGIVVVVELLIDDTIINTAALYNDNDFWIDGCISLFSVFSVLLHCPFKVLDNWETIISACKTHFLYLIRAEEFLQCEA